MTRGRYLKARLARSESSWLWAAVLSTAALSTAALLIPAYAQPAERAITADMVRVDGARDMAWQDCVGADHPGILLRRDNLSQLRTTHEQLGFKYIRFHGIFADDMGAYRELNGKPVYDFGKIDAVYDAILHLGMKPFVELSFMPHDLATSDRTIFYWKANGSPPKDYGKWADFMAAFIQHLEARYGKAEVAQWQFEVWNEPNLDGFWTTGDQQAYFRLYDTTAKAIKAVDPALRVGGPATAGVAWVPEFIGHARAAAVPIDFITTHTYGVEGGFLDQNGEGDNRLSTKPGSISDDVRKVRDQVRTSPMPGLPVYFTEWSTSYNPRDPIHDAYLSAAFVLEKLKKTEGVAQSMSYWTYTDLFEEAGPPPASFHGGFGLINREGIRKAAFFAYRYLNELGAQVLRNADEKSWLTREGDNFSGLIWNYTVPDQDESNRPYFRKLHPPTSLPPINLTVSSLRSGTYRLTLHRTGFKANDAYSQYIEWGLPQNLTPAQVTTLRHLSEDLPETEINIEVGENGSLNRKIPIRTNDVILVKLNRVQ
jgi:xylan 1,4-beta-xylosidase